MIKRIFFVTTILLLLFNTKAFAKTGDIIGKIYSTDILAFINDVPVASYNIGGKTVIIIEDLAEYGVTYTYNDELRSLVAYMDFWDNSAQNQISRGKAGKIVGNIYETNIKTYVNGLPIQAYSLNGKIAVAIEDLCLISDKSMEYSPYNMRCVWNSTDRTISLYFLYDNSNKLFDVLSKKTLSLKINNDIVNIYTNRFHNSFGGEYTGDFNPPSSYPLYCNNQKVGIGFTYTPISIYHSDSEGVRLIEDSWSIRGNYYDVEAIRSIADTIIIPEPNYEETIKYFTEEFFGTILDRVDTDSCTFLYISQGTPHGSSEYLIWIDKNGNYKDFSNGFKSVSFWGTKTFTNLRIEKDQVFFRYDVDYIIDLKSGTMFENISD